MKLVLDAVGNRHGGGATVLCDFLRACADCETLRGIVLFASPRRQREFTVPSLKKLQIIDVEGADGAFGRLRWARRRLDEAVRAVGGDVFLGLNGMGCLRPRMASVVFIQQSLPYAPEALRRCGWGLRFRMIIIRRVNRNAARAAHHVIVQSEAMRRLVVADFRLPEQRFSVIMPTAPRFPTPGSHAEKLASLLKSAGRGMLLYVGNDFPHKNLAVVENGLSRMAAPERPVWAVTLPASSAVCRRGAAVSLGVLGPAELATAYAAATVVVMPSWIETIGLPLLEAMRVGVAVLAADRPYAREVCQNAAHFFDPGSPDDFARKLTQLLCDSDLRSALVARGRSIIERRDGAHPYRQMVEKVIEVATAVRSGRPLCGTASAGDRRAWERISNR